MWFIALALAVWGVTMMGEAEIDDTSFKVAFTLVTLTVCLLIALS